MMVYRSIILPFALIFIINGVNAHLKTQCNLPAPFCRRLKFGSPAQVGRDVVILQNLLQRHSTTKYVIITSKYDVQTAVGVQIFQHDMGLPETAIFDNKTAIKVLKYLLDDGFKDDRKVPLGYKFKLHVPVYKDRRKETMATLFDLHGYPIFKFKVRAHGATYNGRAVNQLTHNGNTPTGLATFDLNSKEPDEKSFGPYPVVRVVKGLEGNCAIGVGNDTLLSNYRSGILLHTGEWEDWDPSKPMPNSLGCIHCSKEDMKNLVEILIKDLDVKVNENPFGKLPYPYKPQGLIAIEQID